MARVKVLPWGADVFAFKFFLMWAAISSVVILFFVKYGVSSKLIFALKDAPLYVFMMAFVFSWLRSFRSFFILIAVVIYFLVLLLNYVVMNGEYSSPLANIRQVIAPIVVLLFFCSIRLDFNSVLSVERFLKFVVFFVFLVGVLEVVFEFWKSFDLSLYFNLKGIPVDQYGLSYMFYEPIIGYRERMTSTFLDPISLGHFFASTFIYFFYKSGAEKKEKLILLVSLVGLVLCFSKGAMLQVFLALTIFNHRLHVGFKFVCAFVPFFVFALIPNKAGILIHLNGLLNAFVSFSFFGHGIGSSGNYAKMFSSDLSKYYELGISDTFAGALIGQVGAFGFFIWVALIFFIISPYRRSNNLDFVILASIVLISLISENTMNVTSFMAPAIIVALAHWRKEASCEK